MIAPHASGTTATGTEPGAGDPRVAARYRAIKGTHDSALWCYRKAREQVAAADRLAFRRWCAEMGFTLSMIGHQAACALAIAEDERAARVGRRHRQGRQRRRLVGGGVVLGVASTGEIAVGSSVLFTYNCDQSDGSAHAHLRGRSPSIVTIVRLCEVEPGWECSSRSERDDAAMPWVYTVRFPDGLEDDAFEDELSEAA